MAKVAFPFHVLHEGRLRAPHEALEVTEAEAKELVGQGAKVLEMSCEALKKASESKAPASTPEKHPYVKKKG